MTAKKDISIESTLPRLSVDHLWEEAQKLIKIGCLKETQSLLEKVISFSHYSHQEALRTIANIYNSKEDSVERLTALWRSATLFAMADDREEDLFKHLLKALKYSTSSQDELFIAISLYAKSKGLNALEKEEVAEDAAEPKILVVATQKQSPKRCALLKSMARDHGQKEGALSFSFLKDAFSDEEQEIPQTVYDYLKGFKCLVTRQPRGLSLCENVAYFKGELLKYAPKIVIFIDPFESGLLTLLSVLQHTYFQVAVSKTFYSYPLSLDLVFAPENINPINRTPLVSFSTEEIDQTFFTTVLERFSHFKEGSSTKIEKGAEEKEDKETDVISEEKEALTSEPSEQGNKKAESILSVAERLYQDKNKKDNPKKPKDFLATQVMQQTSAHILHRPDHPLFVLKKERALKKASRGAEKNREEASSELPTPAFVPSMTKEENANFWAKYITTGDSVPKSDQGSYDLEDSKISFDPSSANEVIDAAIHILQQGDAERALKLISSIQPTLGAIKDLSYVKALCYVALNKLLKALNSVQMELSHFPDNEQAKTLLTDIEQVLKNR
ncbi:MAG: hypothetical protein ACOX2O_04925 [Bdellovibrionota bacterium]|jgi:tetratricopeptide (TPR) repeat protein